MTKIKLNLRQINWAGLGTSLFAGAFGAAAAAWGAGRTDPKSIGVVALTGAAGAAWGFFTQRTDVAGGASPLPGLTSTDSPIPAINRLLAGVPPPMLSLGTDALSIAMNALAAEQANRDRANAAAAAADREARAAAILAAAQKQADAIRQGAATVQTSVQPPNVATYPAPGQG